IGSYVGDATPPPVLGRGNRLTDKIRTGITCEVVSGTRLRGSRSAGDVSTRVPVGSISRPHKAGEPGPCGIVHRPSYRLRGTEVEGSETESCVAPGVSSSSGIGKGVRNRLMKYCSIGS